jgi:thioredoxin reductase
MSSERVLQVGIVGAGIAGLGAAVALRRAGHDVEVSLQCLFCTHSPLFSLFPIL